MFNCRARGRRLFGTLMTTCYICTNAKIISYTIKYPYKNDEPCTKESISACMLCPDWHEGSTTKVLSVIQHKIRVASSDVLTSPFRTIPPRVNFGVTEYLTSTLE